MRDFFTLQKLLTTIFVDFDFVGKGFATRDDAIQTWHSKESVFNPADQVL